MTSRGQPVPRLFGRQNPGRGIPADLVVRPPATLRSRTIQIALVLVTAVASAMVAYLVAGGLTPSASWPGRGVFAAAALLIAPVAFIVVHRFPLSAIIMWLALTPLLQVNAAGSGGRMLYWALHRALPPTVLLLVVLAVMLKLNPKPVPRPGWPELLMLGYVIASYLSVAYLSTTATATTYHLYDRVVVPMCLYLIVRLYEPDEKELRKVLPAVLFLLLTQAVFGLASWAAPGALPGAWLSREGLRTTGSLVHPNVYGSTMIIAGVVALHFGLSEPRSGLRRWMLGGSFGVALAMVFMTYSRASWLAGAVVAFGLLFVYPRFMVKLSVVAAVVIGLVVASGTIDAQIEQAQERFLSGQSEQSALSRLPVVYASLKMFEARPVTGFGYGNFDQFDREFQGRVGNFVAPEKDHASHNLYLTILAEQGLVGFVLYLGPAVWWLLASRSSWRRMPRDGLMGRRLLVVLWLALASHVVVNNFSNMRIEFGLGLWWLILGMIAALVYRHGPVRRYIPAGDAERLSA